MAQVWRSHIGHVREQNYGSTGSGAAVYIPVLSYDTWEDNRERIVDNSFRAVPSKDFFVYDGVASGRVGYTWYFFPDQMNRFIKEIFGAEAVTQSSAGAPGVHTWGSTDTPPSATFYDFYGVAGSERRFQGAQMQNMTLKFDAASGAMSMKGEWLSYAPSTGIAETTFSYTSGIPFRGWEGALTLAGSTNNRLLGFEITFAREIGLVYSASNSQNPIAREVGPLEISGKASFYGGTSSGGSTDTEYGLYRGNTSTSLSLVLADTAAGASNNSLRILLSNANLYPVALDRGNPYTRWDAPFRGLHNATDSGPGSLILTISSTAATT